MKLYENCDIDLPISTNFAIRQFSGNLKESWGYQEAELGEPGRPATERASTKELPGLRSGGTGGGGHLDPALKDKSKNPSKQSLVRQFTKTFKNILTAEQDYKPGVLPPFLRLIFVRRSRIRFGIHSDSKGSLRVRKHFKGIFKILKDMSRASRAVHLAPSYNLAPHDPPI